MANKKSETVPLNMTRFREVRKLRRMTLKDVAEHPNVDRNEKTLRRWISNREIPSDKLDAICQILNVDPLYINGELDRFAEQIDSNPKALSELKAMLHPDDFPYFYKQKREREPLLYIKELMIHNNIAPSELDGLSKKDLIHLYIELERVTSSVLRKYFKPHETTLVCDSMTMPPEEEIVLC